MSRIGSVIAAVVGERRKILIDDLVVIGEGVGRNEVAAADFGAIDLELVRRDVEQPFDDEHAMLPAGAAIGRDDRFVGEDRGKRAVVVGYDVRSEQRALAVDRHRQSVGIVGAGIVQEYVLDAEDAAVGVERDFGVMGLATLLRRSKKMLEPVLDPFDRPVEFHCRPRNHHLFGIEQHDLRPEAAADERRDHPHLPLAQAEHAGEPVAQENRRLGRIPDRELTGAGVPMRDDAAGLDRRRGAVVVAEAAADDMLGTRARRGVVAAALPDMSGDIAAHAVVHAGRTRR